MTDPQGEEEREGNVYIAWSEYKNRSYLDHELRVTLVRR